MVFNGLGREIPEIIGGKKIKAFQGVTKKYAQRKVMGFSKDTSCSKVLESLNEALKKVGLQNGMTVSFHHHLHNGDYVVDSVMKTIADMGFKNINVAASALFPVHAPLIDYIKEGVITGFEVNYMSGPVAQAVSNGFLEKPVVFRSHGGRPRAIEDGDLSIDVAFIAASAADRYGNATGIVGPSRFGVLGYAIPDAFHARKVIIITDHLVDYPLTPISISQNYIDYVVKIDKIGDPKDIEFGSTKITQDPIRLKIAQQAAQVIQDSDLLRSGFSFQTGAGGTSLAVAHYLYQMMKENKIQGSFGGGGITQFFVKMLEEGYFKVLLDTQTFDLVGVESLTRNPNHIEVDASFYANPHNKGCWVDQLDVVILGAAEIDEDFNVNVVTGSDGLIRSGSGGHSDTAAGSKLAIVVAPLAIVKKGIPVIRKEVTTITTPGESIDVLVTEAGIAINPRRKDLISSLEMAKLPLKSIQDLRKEAEDLVGGSPKPIKVGKKIVGIVEYRDGTVIDVIRQIKGTLDL